MKTTICTSLFIFISILLFGTDYYVTNTNDSGPGSLREAIIQTNSSPIGIDAIIFNLELSDPNYNSETGVWIIDLLSALPMISYPSVSIDGSSQQTYIGNTNINGPEIRIQTSTTIEYAFRIVSPNCSISNLNISNFEYAIQIYGTMANGITITENYIGTNEIGTEVSPNEYGIAIGGNAYNIDIWGNLISGNSAGGIVSSEAHDCNIYGNLIGTDRTGVDILANPTGILLESSYNMQIGGNTEEDRNVISGNTDSGMTIYGVESYNNIIIGNYIGSDITGTDTLPNGNGILVISSSDNTIGGITSEKRNLISGNTAAGVVLNGTGANNNLIIGNYIGTDISGELALSNHYGVIIKADADKNTVGGSTPEERNIISANWEIGVYIEASDSNKVSGNYIGTNSLGTDAFYIEGDSLIQANGVEINTVSKYNVIGGETEGERNIISGNRVYGAIYYGQVSENNICGNYIGTDVSGSYSIPNATGICVDDASNNNIIEQNLLSGNISYGLFIVTTGSNYNHFRGNLVGTNHDATDSIPNDVGLLIGGGAKSNIIGGENTGDRNIFSGNRYGGIEISDNGTDYNQIIGNFIGTDYSGNDSISNGFGIGVSNLVTGTQINNNVISGNKTFGIVLTESSDSTIITGNFIGTGIDTETDLGNNACGIAITAGSNNNTIGTIEEPNIIAFNDSCGIVIMDSGSIRNRISGNSIFDNEYLGIDIFPAGVNANDVGDSDTGPNQLMNYPVITDNWFNPELWVSVIEGQIDTENPETCIVEIFSLDFDGSITHGQGKNYIATAYPDETGYWIVQCNDGIGGEMITSVAIDEYGNTSEFSENFNHYTKFETQNLLSTVSIFPNPCNGKLNIQIQENSFVKIELLDYTGRKITNLTDDNSSIVHCNLTKLNLSNGIFFIKTTLSSGEEDIQKLIIDY